LRTSFGNAGVALEASADMHGIALCAVLKNIYAIAFGVCEGMEFGLNVKGKLAVMVLQEMKRFLADNGANPVTAEGVAGLGDMLATGFSEESFNYRVGKSLAEGIAGSHIKSEGLVSLDELSRAVDLKKYPVIHLVNQIVFHYGAPTTLRDLVASTY
jgi:glycerol-3-phosphate dehydrogenase (NAD(P)+)